MIGVHVKVVSGEVVVPLLDTKNNCKRFEFGCRIVSLMFVGLSASVSDRL